MSLELTKPDGKQYDKGSTLEHILPQIYGGRNRLEETLAICAKCNRRRAHRPLHWQMLLRVLILKPFSLWRTILLLHIKNHIGFRKDCMGYYRFGCFHVMEKITSKRKQKAKDFFAQRKARKKKAVAA